MLDTFKAFQSSVKDLFAQRNTIDKLMSDKVEDFHLIEEAPMPVFIGGRLMFVGNLTLENLYVFIDMCARIFANVGIQLTSFDVLANSDEITRLIQTNKKTRKELYKLIKKSVLSNQDYYHSQLGQFVMSSYRLPKVTWSHFKRNVTLETLIQILFMVYTYNFDSVKKNFRIIAEKMAVSNLTENYIYSWLGNLGGLSGAFVKPRYPKYASYVNAKAKEGEEVKADG